MVLQHSTKQLQQLAVVRFERLGVRLNHLVQQQEANLLEKKSTAISAYWPYDTIKHDVELLCMELIIITQKTTISQKTHVVFCFNLLILSKSDDLHPVLN